MQATVPAPKRAGAAAASSTSADLDALADHETPKLQAGGSLRRWAFLLVLMYFSMGHMMWGWPRPRLASNGNHVAMGLCAAAAGGHRHGDQPEVLRERLHGLCSTARPTWTRWWHMGAMASFVWMQHVRPVRHDRNAQVRRRQWTLVMRLDCLDFTFESAAMILTLITVGQDAGGPRQGQDHRCAQRA